MEEDNDIKVLEEYFNRICFDETNKITADLCTIGINEIRAIENLIQRNKELEVINKMQEYRISVIDERELISKSKVREKIEELKKEMKQDEVDEFGIHSIGWGVLDYVIEQLKELLQEGDE